MIPAPESRISLEEKRRSEERSCPKCAMAVENPFIERCPRCWTALPKVNLDCQGCFHHSSCPVAKLTPH